MRVAQTNPGPAQPLIDLNDPPATRWRQFLDHLPPSPRAVLVNNAVFAGVDESGRLTLNVRTAVMRNLVKSNFEPLDPSPWFPTFRNVDVRIDSGGVTGNERRTAAQDALVARATAAAEASPLLKRVLDTFGGTLERVETIATVAPETALPSVEDDEGE